MRHGKPNEPAQGRLRLFNRVQTQDYDGRFDSDFERFAVDGAPRDPGQVRRDTGSGPGAVESAALPASERANATQAGPAPSPPLARAPLSEDDALAEAEAPSRLDELRRLRTELAATTEQLERMRTEYEHQKTAAHFLSRRLNVVHRSLKQSLDYTSDLQALLRDRNDQVRALQRQLRSGQHESGAAPAEADPNALSRSGRHDADPLSPLMQPTPSTISQLDPQRPSADE